MTKPSGPYFEGSVWHPGRQFSNRNPSEEEEGFVPKVIPPEYLNVPVPFCPNPFFDF
jgi:hypothetical protein